MRKAILWLCWGERFVDKAVASARSAASVEADRILITDTAGAAFADSVGVFSEIITTQLHYSNNLEKSRLIDLVPGGYDLFLFLDTDTLIVDDISLGFTKAAEHGIAMVPAPNYNLGEYFNFAGIMRQVGVEPADQMMYNSGVIFFRPTGRARHALERWRDLCCEFGTASGATHDQPFLTFALEQSGITPYVLSPAYNYRNLGEYAVGKIRIWHSHIAPPAGFNVFKTAWPARRFNDSVRRDAGDDPASIAPRRPQAMAVLPLDRKFRQVSREAAPGIATAARAIEQSQGSRKANEFILNWIGLRCSDDLDEGYFSEALHYHLGLLHSHAANPAEMAEQFRQSRTMPTDEDDLMYSDHVNLSFAINARQRAAVGRGLPPILIACMPRSASSTLTYTLGRALDIPVMHVSAGTFLNRYIVPSWLDMFLEGGAITQDHFGANEFNIGVLQSRGIHDVFVLVRDPRAAARSWERYRPDGQDLSETLSGRIGRQCINNFIPWLKGWIDCSNSQRTIQIHWITYRDVCQGSSAILHKIGEILGVDSPSSAAFKVDYPIKELRMHYVEGSDEGWRRDLDSSTRDIIWEAFTPEMRSLLDLQA